MISTEFASKELLRLAGLDFYPNTSTPEGQAAWKELRLALQSAASETIAHQAVTYWLFTKTDAPKPAELYALANPKPTEYWDAGHEHFDCMLCSDRGLNGGSGQPWAFCACAAGQRRMAEDPGAAVNANSVRERLLKRFGSNKSERVDRLARSL